jgi:hypothetical protein
MNTAIRYGTAIHVGGIAPLGAESNPDPVSAVARLTAWSSSPRHAGSGRAGGGWGRPDSGGGGGAVPSARTQQG